MRDKDKAPIPKKNTHTSIIITFKKSSVKERVQIGANLDRMKINRIKMDYKDTFIDNLPKTVADSLKRAQEIIDSLVKL